MLPYFCYSLHYVKRQMKYTEDVLKKHMCTSQIDIHAPYINLFIYKWEALVWYIILELTETRPTDHFLQLFVPAVKKNGEAGADQVILITIINEKDSVICIWNNLIMTHSNKALSAQWYDCTLFIYLFNYIYIK